MARRGITDDWSYWKLALIGVIAGLIGGAVMWVLMTLVCAIVGPSLWAFPKWVADAVYGDSWLGFDLQEVLTGTLIHLAVAASLGLLFSVILVPFLPELRFMLIAGLVWGLIAWVVLTLIALNGVDPVMAQEVPNVAWFLMHIIFGLIVGYVANGLKQFAEI
ncbi:MAG: hypothetical protein M1118_15545 [Chloroflexi bacterium]|nr:hypothetical protein [Chloroflexota bacterium]